MAAALAQRNIPPHNPAAKTAEEAYRVYDLVPPLARDALEVRRLFPAADKPDYRAKLKSSGQVRRGGYWWGMGQCLVGCVLGVWQLQEVCCSGLVRT